MSMGVNLNYGVKLNTHFSVLKLLILREILAWLVPTTRFFWFPQNSVCSQIGCVSNVIPVEGTFRSDNPYSSKRRLICYFAFIYPFLAIISDLKIFYCIFYCCCRRSQTCQTRYPEDWG